MKRALLWLGGGLLALLLTAAALALWFLLQRLPQREGTLPLAQLQAPVTVRYDEAGVPHIQAEHEADLYRALGYVHAQDRLFQMEMLRRLARGELAEVLGPKLLPTDRLFRSLDIRRHADDYAARMDPERPATRALQAYLDGINQYQASRPAPLEFALLGIPKRPFTAADSVSVVGYLAYSFASAFKTEPVLTQIREQLGPDYLLDFDLSWHPEGAAAHGAGSLGLASGQWQGLQRLATLSQDAITAAGLPQAEGSNAWVLSGRHTASGKPLLAGDPHITLSTPAVWYEAHLRAPGFELYGHYPALIPMALLGHNLRFGWSLTMFQNDDIDLIVETTDAQHPGQVLIKGQWQPLSAREELIAVKGQPPERVTLRQSPHGPIVNDALGKPEEPRPIAMWWAFLQAENPIFDAFYQLNRADTLATARQAVQGIHAPGLNVVWANAAGDIAWWAAAKLPQRPAGVNPTFLLDGRSAEADKPGWRPFSDNPQEENPSRGWLVSANHQPAGHLAVAGYYNAWDRALVLSQQLSQARAPWTQEATRRLQLGVQTGHAQRVLSPLLPALRAAAGADPQQTALVEQLARWDGSYPLDNIAPTVFTQFLYELARAAMRDELGEAAFANLCRTRAFEQALPRLAANAGSAWWDRRDTPDRREGRDEIVQQAWQATLAHLRHTFGPAPEQWAWGSAHTVTHKHPLGQQAPLDKVLNVGPFPAPGTREVPNNLAQPFGPAPWAVAYAPSTRRIIDFGRPERALGINPVGQSGVWGDPHYRDQAQAWVQGEHRPQHLSEADVAQHTRSTLRFVAP